MYFDVATYLEGRKTTLESGHRRSKNLQNFYFHNSGTLAQSNPDKTFSINNSIETTRAIEILPACPFLPRRPLSGSDRVLETRRFFVAICSISYRRDRVLCQPRRTLEEMDQGLCETRSYIRLSSTELTFYSQHGDVSILVLPTRTTESRPEAPRFVSRRNPRETSTIALLLDREVISHFFLIVYSLADLGGFVTPPCKLTNNERRRRLIEVPAGFSFCRGNKGR
jgi:hypothetical protein